MAGGGYVKIPCEDLGQDHQGRDSDVPLLHLPFRHLAVVTVSLPFLGFLFCTFWSLCFEFERSTSTHCHVKNYLPSISASIGGYTPQVYIWRICIGLHAAPRFLVACMYGRFYKQTLVDKPLWRRVGVALALLHGLENSCLIGLTYVSSTDNYPVHEKFFVTFVICAFVYMLASSIVPHMASKRFPNAKVLRVLKIKTLLTVANLLGSACAVYFFIRHNTRCEPGMYTMFALCEYIVVLSNMGFHMCAYWDFGDQVLSISGFKLHQKERRIQEVHVL